MRKTNILWIDGLGALVAGVVVLLISGWLSELYRMPKELLIFIGTINVIYGSYSTPLAIRSERPKKFINFLVAANLTWTLVCFILGFKFIETASIFGLIHLFGEGLYVGSLACLEWRWREIIRFRKSPDLIMSS